jgi:pectate lyase
LTAIIVPVVAGAGVLVSALPAQAASAPVAGSTYQLAVTKSGQCLDVVGGATGNGSVLQQWGCSGGAAWQQFKAVSAGSGQFTLVNAKSAKCVDVPAASAAAGVQINQWTCSGNANQRWTFVASGSGTYQVKSVSSGLCLSDKGASTASGSAVIQEACTASSNKQWAFNPVTASTGRTWSNAADGFASTGGGTTGGAAGTTVTVTTYDDLVKYASASAAYVIRVNAAITVPSYGFEIPVSSNKTIIGVGKKGEIVHGGLHLNPGTHNVIIRNLTIRDTRMTEDDPGDKDYDYDGIQMDTADHIWIDHNTIERMNDGLIDSRKDTTYLTVSWNVIAEGHKAFGIGWTDHVTSRMTIHHNWIHDNGIRNPSTDNVAYAHLYNNYMQNITGYGNYSRGATKMVLENTYFDGVNDPFYHDPNAQLKQSGSIVVNSTGKQTTSGSAFDPSSFYSYTLDSAASVPALLKTYAGPQSNIGN